MNAISMFDVDNYNGELRLDVSDGNYGDAFYDFVQSLLKITDVTYLSKEQRKSLFMERFRNLMSEQEEYYNIDFDWSDPVFNKKEIFKVDCKIQNDKQTIFVYAISNDRKTRDVTIALHQFNAWGINYRPLGIFEGGKKHGKSVLERFVHVCDEYFMGISENYVSILSSINKNLKIG